MNLPPSKPIRVALGTKASGDIHGGSKRKKAWDFAILAFASILVDVSDILLKNQKGSAMSKLREHLDSEFDYESFCTQRAWLQKCC